MSYMVEMKTKQNTIFAKAPKLRKSKFFVVPSPSLFFSLSFQVPAFNESTYRVFSIHCTAAMTA